MPNPADCAGCAKGCHLPGDYKDGQDARCYLYHHSAPHRRHWDGEDGEVAFGVKKERGPCFYRGAQLGEVDCDSCGRSKDGTQAKVRVKVFGCNGGHGQCTIAKELPGGVACCKTCPDHALDDRFRPKDGDPPCGVVVGVYWWTPLVELQIKAVRHFCGDVPILISDDASPDGRGERMEALCALYKGVDFVRSKDRIGHAGGDLAAFSRGLAWAKGRGVKVLAKLSQRFVAAVPRWLQDGARDLLASGLHLAGQSCTEGPHRFPLRTEAVLLDVDAWATPEALAYFAGRPIRNAAEAVVWHGCQLWHGGTMHPWGLLGGVNRRRPAPGVLWHTNTAEQAYRDLAARFGVDLGAEFSVGGSHLLPDYRIG